MSKMNHVVHFEMPYENFAKKIKGSVCIGSDLDENKVECWTTKDIDEGDCIKTLVEHFEPEHIPSKPPEDWIKPLFEKEIIKLK